MEESCSGEMMEESARNSSSYAWLTWNPRCLKLRLRTVRMVRRERFVRAIEASVAMIPRELVVGRV
jgi:hypothetical protein